MLQAPDPDPQGYLREIIHFKDMIFHVDVNPAGGLNLYCGNSRARLYVLQLRSASSTNYM